MEKLKKQFVNPWAGLRINWDTPVAKAVELINSAKIVSGPLVKVDGYMGFGKTTFAKALENQGLFGMDGDLLRCFAASRFFLLLKESTGVPLVDDYRKIAEEAGVIGEGTGSDEFFASSLDSSSSIGDVKKELIRVGLFKWEEPNVSEPLMLKVIAKCHYITGVKSSSDFKRMLFQSRSLWTCMLIPNYRSYVHYSTIRNEKYEEWGVDAKHILTHDEYLSFYEDWASGDLIRQAISTIMASGQKLEQFIHESDSAGLKLRTFLIPHDYSQAAMRATANFVAKELSRGSKLGKGKGGMI